jgi:hypothetical protein
VVEDLKMAGCLHLGQHQEVRSGPGSEQRGRKSPPTCRAR